MKILYIITLTSLFLMSSCVNSDPNVTSKGVDELKSLELERTLSNSDKRFEDIVYVPIYSDIYFDLVNQNLLISATLSIRNTSIQDSLFISVIDYYNTEGVLVRKFIDQPIALSPMASVNYVIEKEDSDGGPGANFIVNLYSENPNIKPLIQAVMVGSHSNKAFAFATDGYSIE